MHKKIIISIISLVIILFLLGSLFLRFNKQKRISAIGKYKSTAPSTLEKAKLALSNIECFYSGRQLDLLPDSTFTLTDSTVVIKGTWQQKNDLFEFHITVMKQAYSDSLKGKKLDSTAQYFTLDYFNPDLYYFLPNSRENCVEIFKIK